MFTPEIMQEIERNAFAGGATAEALMEEAGRQMAAAVKQFCPIPGKCVALFGKGHNGGDALVAARHLSEMGWSVTLVPAFSPREWAPLTARKWDQAGLCETVEAARFEHWRPPSSEPCVLLDGLLGIGARGALRPPVSCLCRLINKLRLFSSPRVFALDIPTGLDGASGQADADAVVADVTLSVGFAKTGLLQDGAEKWVGRLAVLPLETLGTHAPPVDPLEIASPPFLRTLWPRRRADVHKGACGRVTLVAGARGTVGAAALAARGALRAGAGLVTLCVPEDVYPVAAFLAPQECMVRPLADLREALTIKADALGVGPGLGLQNLEGVRRVVRDFPGPAVVDADALNGIAQTGLSVLGECAGPRLLTPHPGEMRRLDAVAAGLGRRACVEVFTRRWPVTLLLKGARTVVGTGGTRVSYNTTGNPGMASGGMGDVLTGVCSALLAQGLACHEAALLGAWLCGRSAEALVSGGVRSEESLLASDVADGLGAAFEALRGGGV